MTTGALAALLGTGALIASATTADARVVCNNWGDCWHVRDRYHYPPGLGIRVYNDNWRDRHHWDNDWYWHHKHYRWHEHHDGRGYWRDGVWITF
ncbi:MAG: hypothetical protein JSR60_09805 [Proteobacteria bacterium]|nr:hypothetical protein [Pseudomonadota bacterium]